MAFVHKTTCARAQHSDLFNENTNDLETAIVGTEYISPQQHGSIYGTIYRRYYTIGSTTNGVDITIPLGFNPTGNIIDYGAMVLDGNDWLKLPFTGETDESTKNIKIIIDVGTSDQIEICPGSSASFDSGHMWIDYTK